MLKRSLRQRELDVRVRAMQVEHAYPAWVVHNRRRSREMEIAMRHIGSASLALERHPAEAKRAVSVDPYELERTDLLLGAVVAPLHDAPTLTRMLHLAHMYAFRGEAFERMTMEQFLFRLYKDANFQTMFRPRTVRFLEA